MTRQHRHRNTAPARTPLDHDILSISETRVIAD